MKILSNYTIVQLRFFVLDITFLSFQEISSSLELGFGIESILKNSKDLEIGTELMENIIGINLIIFMMYG